jgi:hypothetical protein
MIELTAKERETVIQILRKHPGAGSDVDVEGFLKEKPLASLFFAMAARGQMKDRRVATDAYLRSLPDDLLERLALALREFKSEAEGREEDKRLSDLLLVLTLVVAQEKQAGGFKATDIEMAVFMDRFARDTVLIVKHTTHNLGRMLDNQHGISRIVLVVQNRPTKSRGHSMIQAPAPQPATPHVKTHRVILLAGNNLSAIGRECE